MELTLGTGRYGKHSKGLIHLEDVALYCKELFI